MAKGRSDERGRGTAGRHGDADAERGRAEGEGRPPPGAPPGGRRSGGGGGRRGHRLVRRTGERPRRVPSGELAQRDIDGRPAFDPVPRGRRRHAAGAGCPAGRRPRPVEDPCGHVDIAG
ncbi:hypothetical protein AB852_06920 [Streptomyces uncialis]|uniref:Uncharacterized protein n=1 Tax=Streptomyces uncialis TaxID=1048205 RepID=A0A1Q4VEV0_9ACTN|nr:hypothetical protein AB852_06920 [Streptomyces uncialis]